MERRVRSGASLRRLVAGCLVAVYAFLACAGVGLVRCHEADGSVRLEWRGVGCCSDGAADASAPQGPSATSEDAAGSCDACTDVAVSDQLVAQRRAHADPVTVSLPAPEPCASVTVQCIVPAGDAGPSPRREPPRPRVSALRTVFLRC